MKKILISLLLLNLLAACASQQTKAPVVETPVPPTATNAAPAASTAATGVMQDGGTSTMAAPQEYQSRAVDPFDDPNNVLSKRSVYYPFDVSAVQDEDKPVVQAHAKYLSEHANRKVRLEGNCDERGSNEYNLALGQRRADGVKKMMELAGARESQLESVSYGEEKPRATDHNEAAWSQNRRTDLNYLK